MKTDSILAKQRRWFLRYAVLKTIGLAMLGLFAFGPVQADQITVTASQQTNGRLSSLTLAFPSAAKASSVWVASGPKDEGTVLGNWQSLSFGAEVAAGETSCTVPVNLSGGETAVRLIMLENTDEFVELESVSSSGGAYVKTGFVPSGHTYVRCDFKFDTLKGSALFGARTAAGNNSFCMLELANTGFRYDYANGISNSYVVPTAGTRYLAEMDHRSLRINGTPLAKCTRSDGVATFSPNQPLMVFAMNNNGTASSPADATIYSFKCWSNWNDLSGTLVTDLVPCRKKDGTVGLINRKTGGFQTTTGTLTAGAEKAHSTLGTVLTSVAVDACGLARTLSVEKTYRKAHKVCADLSFSTALADSLLVAAYGSEDAGETLADWPNSVVLSVVPATTTQMTATIPATVDDGMKAIRYFLLPRCSSDAYDRLFDGIRATGTQYVITDFTPNWTTLVVADFAFDDVNETQVPFSARTTSWSNAFAVLHTATQGFRLDYAGWIGNSNPLKKATAGEKFQISASSYLNVDDKRVVTVPDAEKKSFTAGAPLTLFALNNAGVVSACSKAVCHSFYAWKEIGNDATRVLDLVPCEKNGEVGFYNKVNGKFYGNDGTGAFVPVGPEAVNTNAPVVAVSAALPTPPPPGMLFFIR